MSVGVCGVAGEGLTVGVVLLADTTLDIYAPSSDVTIGISDVLQFAVFPIVKFGHMVKRIRDRNQVPDRVMLVNRRFALPVRNHVKVEIVPGIDPRRPVRVGFLNKTIHLVVIIDDRVILRIGARNCVGEPAVVEARLGQVVGVDDRCQKMGGGVIV